MELESGEEDLVVAQAPSYVPSTEDDEFLASIDKMVNKNINDSKNLLRDKSQLTSLTAPVSTVKGKKNWDQLQEEDGAGEDGQDVQVELWIFKKNYFYDFFFIFMKNYFFNCKSNQLLSLLKMRATSKRCYVCVLTNKNCRA